MTTLAPAAPVPLSVKCPEIDPTTFDASQLMVAAFATIVGTSPPVSEVCPLLGRPSSMPGPAAIAAAGARRAEAHTAPVASQPAVRREKVEVIRVVPERW